MTGTWPRFNRDLPREIRIIYECDFVTRDLSKPEETVSLFSRNIISVNIYVTGSLLVLLDLLLRMHMNILFDINRYPLKNIDGNINGMNPR